MIRIPQVIHVAIWAIAMQMKEELARFLGTLVIIALALGLLWSSAQPHVAVGLLGDWRETSDGSSIFVQLTQIGTEETRILRLPSAEIPGLPQQGGRDWVLAQGAPESLGGFQILDVTDYRILQLGWLASALRALPSVTPEILFLAAIVMLVLNHATLAFVSAGTLAVLTFVATWSLLTVLAFGGGLTGGGVTVMGSAAICASVAGAIAFRIVTTTPNGLLTRLLSVVAALLILQTGLLPGWALPGWATTVIGLAMPRLSVATLITMLAGPALGASDGLAHAIVAAAIVLMATLGVALAPPAPDRRNRRTPRRALFGGGRPTEPEPAQIDCSGRFNWQDFHGENA